MKETENRPNPILEETVYAPGYTPRLDNRFYELFTSHARYLGMGMDPAGEHGQPLTPRRSREMLGSILGGDAPAPPCSTASLYIHLPFCRSRCPYCLFYLNPLGKYLDRHTAAVVRQLSLFAETRYCTGLHVRAVYLGGGTPTAIGAERLKSILQAVQSSLPQCDERELTVESNAVDLTGDMLDMLAGQGVIRVSLGVQTFDTGLRRSIGRTVDISKIEQALREIRELGMKADIDLLYGLPGQRVEGFVDDVRRACALNVDSLSQYRMKLAPHLPLAGILRDGSVPPLPSRAEWTDMQVAGMQEARKAGYLQWNIKNFARTHEDICRYSHIEEYPVEVIPAGSGAGGHLGGLHFSQNRNLGAFISAYGEDECGAAPFDNRDSVLFAGAAIENAGLRTPEYAYLEALRGTLQQAEGADLERLGGLYGVDPLDLHREALAQLEETGLIELQENRVKLTLLGTVWYSNVATRFTAGRGLVTNGFPPHWHLPGEIQ
jgi:oxygen-independent coproporphyrinogen-3 oxidase